MTDLEALAKSLTEAQRRAVASATFSSGNGVWHPAGWYCSADRRVRYNLCRARLTRDYLFRSNRLTPLGEALRSRIGDQG